MHNILYPAHNLRYFSLFYPANKADWPHPVHLYVDRNSQRPFELFTSQREEAFCAQPAVLLRPSGDHYHRPRDPENS